jgi:hypothetical protein
MTLRAMYGRRPSCKRNLVLTALSLPFHAREGRTDPLEPPGRRYGCWPMSLIFFLADSGSGRTMELGRSGRTIDHAAAAAAMVRSARASSARFSYGVSFPKIPSARLAR